jgi:hypothetical protein
VWLNVLVSPGRSFSAYTNLSQGARFHQSPAAACTCSRILATFFVLCMYVHYSYAYQRYVWL